MLLKRDLIRWSDFLGGAVICFVCLVGCQAARRDLRKSQEMRLNLQHVFMCLFWKKPVLIVAFSSQKRPPSFCYLLSGQESSVELVEEGPSVSPLHLPSTGQTLRDVLQVRRPVRWEMKLRNCQKPHTSFCLSFFLSFFFVHLQNDHKTCCCSFIATVIYKRIQVLFFFFFFLFFTLNTIICLLGWASTSLKTHQFWPVRVSWWKYSYSHKDGRC